MHFTLVVRMRKMTLGEKGFARSGTAGPTERLRRRASGTGIHVLKRDSILPSRPASAPTAPTHARKVLGGHLLDEGPGNVP